MLSGKPKYSFTHITKIVCFYIDKLMCRIWYFYAEHNWCEVIILFICNAYGWFRLIIISYYTKLTSGDLITMVINVQFYFRWVTYRKSKGGSHDQQLVKQYYLLYITIDELIKMFHLYNINRCRFHIPSTTTLLLLRNCGFIKIEVGNENIKQH